MIRKRLAAAAALLLGVMFALSGCAGDQPEDDSGKLKVVCTLFPQYDFTREIAGDLVDLTLLLPPGVESHSFDPSAKDIKKARKCGLFIYTGEQMEAWASAIIDMVDKSKTTVLDVSKGIALDPVHEDHGENGGEEGEHEQEHEQEHEHPFDPHIWTNPLNAVKMAQSISAELRRLDPANAAAYAKNEQAFIIKLNALDEDFRAAAAGGKRKTIVFADKFALHYFVKEYGLGYLAAFDSCSTETEPSAEVMARIMKTVKTKQIPVVFYAELTDPKTARVVSAETGAKIRLFHSCHNVSADEFKQGEGYLTLMEKNLACLREALA